MDIHNNCHPHLHNMELLDHVKRSIAASYTSLLSRLDSHIEDDRMHVSCEEKDTWNNKADKIQIRDLEMRLIEKADYCDVVELKEELARLKANSNNTSGDSDQEDYITESELERALNEIREIIRDIQPQNPDLTGYATENWVNTKLGGYALVGDYYTKSQIDERFNGIVQPDLSGYIKNTDTLFTLNNTAVKKGDSITVGGGVTGLTADQVQFVQDSNVPTSGDSSYKIGDLKVASTTYPIYGKDVVGQGGSGGTNGGYYEIAFKAFTHGTTISTVRNNMPANTLALTNNWSHSAENSNGSKDVWMVNRWISGQNVPNEWQGPWQISGASGENGIDGDKMEYVYALSTDDTLSQALVNALGTQSQVDDYIPSGWHDHPQGVSKEYPYEWMAFRIKTHSAQDPNGTWGPFVGPVLWSHYGQNGTDGDGIEYIFFAAADGQTYGNADPSTWSTSAEGFQEREYYKDGWTDDPINIESLGKGARQWVSIRKKYADVEGEEPTWHAYSIPALWSYYAKDGQSSGVVQAIQYSVQPTFSNVTVTWAGDDLQTDTISGTIKWRIVRSEGTNISVVGSQNDYSITTEALVGGQDQLAGMTYNDGEFIVANISQTYSQNKSFIEILAYENNVPVASSIVPIIIPGRKGDRGENGDDAILQSLDFEVLRVRVWNANPDPAYNNGTVTEDGIKYLDIVEHNGVLYKCLKAGTSVTPGDEPNPADPAWATFSAYGDGWFETMIAKSAYIQSLTAKQVVVTDSNNAPVAGMLSGTAIPTQLGQRTNNNGIRIFAGNVPSNGDVSDADFTVDNAGKVIANNAEIKGGSIGGYTIYSNMLKTERNALGQVATSIIRPGEIYIQKENTNGNGSITIDENGINMTAGRIVVYPTYGPGDTSSVQVQGLTKSNILSVGVSSFSDGYSFGQLGNDYDYRVNGSFLYGRGHVTLPKGVEIGCIFFVKSDNGDSVYVNAPSGEHIVYPENTNTTDTFTAGDKSCMFIKANSTTWVTFYCG